MLDPASFCFVHMDAVTSKTGVNGQREVNEGLYQILSCAVMNNRRRTKWPIVHSLQAATTSPKE